MFSGGGGVSYPKLKTNLRLAAQRLKLLQKKKTEENLKARRELAEILKQKKADRARIRVENIIREDYTVEAYELIEMYCDLLVARFGLIETQKCALDAPHTLNTILTESTLNSFLLMLQIIF